MKIIFNFFIWLLIISAIVYSRWIYFDPENGCKLVIVPSFQPSNQNTKDVIKALKLTAPDHYSKLCQNVTYINKNPSCGGFDGGCYNHSKTNTIYLGNDQGNPALAAAVVIHETCHVIQGLESRSFNEEECYQLGTEYLEKVTRY